MTIGPEGVHNGLQRAPSPDVVTAVWRRKIAVAILFDNLLRRLTRRPAARRAPRHAENSVAAAFIYDAQRRRKALPAVEVGNAAQPDVAARPPVAPPLGEKAHFGPDNGVAAAVAEGLAPAGGKVLPGRQPHEPDRWIAKGLAVVEVLFPVDGPPAVLANHVAHEDGAPCGTDDLDRHVLRAGPVFDAVRRTVVHKAGRRDSMVVNLHEPVQRPPVSRGVRPRNGHERAMSNPLLDKGEEPLVLSAVRMVDARPEVGLALAARLPLGE